MANNITGIGYGLAASQRIQSNAAKANQLKGDQQEKPQITGTIGGKKVNVSFEGNKVTGTIDGKDVALSYVSGIPQDDGTEVDTLKGKIGSDDVDLSSNPYQGGYIDGTIDGKEVNAHYCWQEGDYFTYGVYEKGSNESINKDGIIKPQKISNDKARITLPDNDIDIIVPQLITDSTVYEGIEYINALNLKTIMKIAPLLAFMKKSAPAAGK